MRLNEFERIIIDEALSDLLFLIQEGVPHFKNAVAEDITKNTLAITSSKMKLKRIPTDTTQGFTLQEMKVIYWALSILRDTTLEFLDSAPLEDPDRDTAIDTQKTCNRLMRSLREAFSQQGIDIQKLFPQKQS